jgi:hypothetical protein
MRIVGLLSAVLCLAGSLEGQVPGEVGRTDGAPVPVEVAAPTGDTATDRASIRAALDRAGPGGTVHFAAGTYHLGPFLEVAVPGITLLGHPEGTTIRGCTDPDRFPSQAAAVEGCNGFLLTGGRQTVRNLTFERTWHALHLGPRCLDGPCPPGSPAAEALARGGYLVEGNTFRASQNGIRVFGQWSEPAVIRDNDFVNTYHAVMVNGMTAHVLSNRISVPEPDAVPTTRHPGLALLIGGWEAMGAPACNHNIMADNEVRGHPDGIWIMVFDGGHCRGNVIRGNTVEHARIPLAAPSTALQVRDSTDANVSGVPMALLNGVMGDGAIEETLVEGNRVVSAVGLALEVVGATGTRISGNTFDGVHRRTPFPGNTLLPPTPGWGQVNGAAIWISPGSDANEIVGNLFRRLDGPAVALDGDRNRVRLDHPDDQVRDRGRGNRVERVVRTPSGGR